MSKRVYCLYRVSTKGQVEKDDIPMQKQRCREFAQEKGWDITKEFTEKGISGYKVSAKDRDAIQEIQKDAAMNEFDILLVFMFDRLGRREDETPFVVEWFVKNGIEVWSAEEGQQKFENHVDKLMNYIRYWQASGESIKTSVRTKTRLGQIVQEGRFRGGCAPYGYRLVQNGRLGKKNRKLYDIEIDPTESATIRQIFDLADQYGYGGRKISTTLKERGTINQRNGEPFHYSSIQNILRNIMYMGILRSGEIKSDIFPELQIVEPEQFERIESGRKQRAVQYYQQCEASQGDEFAFGGKENDAVHTVPRKNVGRALLSGNIFCGHCGGRIFASTTRKSHHPVAGDKPERISIYKCYNRTQHKERCDGPTSYRAEKVDQVVEQVIKEVLQRAKAVRESDLIQGQLTISIVDYQIQLKNTKTEYAKNVRELSKWETLMLDSIEGKCVFSPEQVKRRMDAVQGTMDELSHRIKTLQVNMDESEALVTEIQAQHQRLLSWAELYSAASLEERKMVASYMIKAVTLTRDYGIQIEFNISEAQYLCGMTMT